MMGINNTAVLLVSLDWERMGDRRNLGMASIAAALKGADLNYQLLEAAVNEPDYNRDEVESRIINAVKAIEADGFHCLLGIGAYVWNEEEVLRFTEQVHSRTSASIVLGGPQISYAAKSSLERSYPYVDFFVRGYGEKAMVALAKGDMREQWGIHIAGTPDKGFMAQYSLEGLASPYLHHILPPGESVRWETQRGCQFKCSFCQHKEPGNRSVYLGMDDLRLSQEIRLFAEKDVQRISVLDPIFHRDSRRACEILKMIKQSGVKAQLVLQCRFETLTDEFLDALQGMDAYLEFGLQTAIPREGKIIRRPNHLATIAEKIRQLNERTIPFEVSLIYGLPEQTLESFKHSLKWCWRQGVPKVTAWPLMLLKGTELYQEKTTFGFVESSETAIPHVIASNSFGRREYSEMAKLANNLNQQTDFQAFFQEDYTDDCICCA